MGGVEGVGWSARYRKAGVFAGGYGSLGEVGRDLVTGVYCNERFIEGVLLGVEDAQQGGLGVEQVVADGCLPEGAEGFFYLVEILKGGDEMDAVQGLYFLYLYLEWRVGMGGFGGEGSMGREFCFVEEVYSLLGIELPDGFGG